MSYPQYPNNRLIVNGVDLSERFKMVLIDEYEFKPPTPKTYVVDIPGGDGKLDLTDSLIGDTVYDNREQTYVFKIIDVDDFERVKTSISNFLHGKAFDYQITMDPDYTYHGRFTVSEYNHASYSEGIVGDIKIDVSANPFKTKPSEVYRINAVGGIVCRFISGRKRTRPTIESDGFLKVIFGGKKFLLPKGTWSINDMLFEEGVNPVYFNSYDIRNLTWGDMKTGVLWGDLKTKKLFEWYKTSSDMTMVTKTWLDVNNQKWSAFKDSKWKSLSHKIKETEVVNDIFIKYEVGDL